MNKLLILIALTIPCFAQPKRATPMMFIGEGFPDVGCIDGNMYFRTDGTAGENLYLCSSGKWYKSGGNTTATISAGKYKDRGTCNTANLGQVVIFSDSKLQGYCDGNDWIDSYAGARVTLPWSDGTKVGNIVRNADSGYIVQRGGRGPNGHNWSFSVKPLPDPPYSIKLGMAPAGQWANEDRCALILRSSDTGKFITVSPLTMIGTQILTTIEKWNGPGMKDSSAYSNYNPVMQFNAGISFVSVSDTGKVRTYEQSSDGIEWFDLIGSASNDFIKPDQYGYGCSSYSPNSNQAAIFFSLSEQ